MRPIDTEDLGPTGSILRIGDVVFGELLAQIEANYVKLGYIAHGTQYTPSIFLKSWCQLNFQQRKTDLVSWRESFQATSKAGRWSSTPDYFFLYTFSPTFSVRSGMVTFPSVEAMMIVFPEADGPNSLDRSTLMVNKVPSTVISTFFMIVASQWWISPAQALFE